MMNSFLFYIIKYLNVLNLKTVILSAYYLFYYFTCYFFIELINLNVFFIYDLRIEFNKYSMS